MVLQTSCRCLRQVERDSYETALIWLNEFNADKLKSQLKQQQHITIEEFTSVREKQLTEILRHSRMKHLMLPPVDYYQLKVQYDTLTIDSELNTSSDITSVVSEETKEISVTKTETLQGNTLGITVDKESGDESIAFNQWIHQISKESFGFVTIKMLKEYENELVSVFNSITYTKRGICYYSSKFDQELIRSKIRKAFYIKRTFSTKEEVIPQSAGLLRVENLVSPYYTSVPERFFPSQAQVDNIIKADAGKVVLNKKTMKAIKVLEELGQKKMADDLRNANTALPERNKSYHYLPYYFDSGFEMEFLKEVVALSIFKDMNLEIYYNGDRELTEFRVRCFKGGKGKWRYIGQYTPDFLLLSRMGKSIHKVIIIETKGSIYASDKDFVDKRDFIRSTFIDENNKKFGYNRFDYLYLEDSLSDSQRIEKTAQAISNFFEGDN